MSTSGNNLQQRSVVPPSEKPATPETFVVNTAGGALPVPVKKSSAMQPPPLLENNTRPVFIAPPPLMKPRSGVKRSYTSLKAMTNPFEGLLHQPQDPVTAKVTSVTSEEVIDDGKAVSDLCQALNSGEGVTISDEKTPSIARSTLFHERSLTAKDIIGAIDEAWGMSALPKCEIIDK
jgi:hypothetical protein